MLSTLRIVPAVRAAVGNRLRAVGVGFDSLGRALQGKDAYIEKLADSTRVVAFGGRELKHGKQAFIAHSATVVGDVTLGELSSVWFSATVRGDAAAVTIGSNTCVQDGAVVEGSKAQGVQIGSNVTISPGALVMSCTIADGACVGMGARMLPGSSLGAGSFLDAGAVLSAGVVMPAGELWTGAPAAKLRVLTGDEARYLASLAQANVQLSQRHYEQSIKTVADLEADEATRAYREEHYMAPEEPIPTTSDEVQQYYRLSAHPEDQGLFRTQNYDDEGSLKQMMLEQDAADREEDVALGRLASEARMWEVSVRLAAVRPDRDFQRDALLKELEVVDSEAAAALRDLVARARSTAGNPEAEAAFKAEVSRLCPRSETGTLPDVLAGLLNHGAAINKLSA